MIKYVLFDLDGTLLSTLPTITYHLNGALSAHGLGRITEENTREYIGNGARKLVTRAVNKGGVDDEALIGAVLSDYNRAYDTDPLSDTEPYEGIVSLVDRLYAEGYKLGVVTNKPDPTAKKLISHFFGDKISIVSGGRAGIMLKPDPTESLSVLEYMGGEASECAFVGDTSVDILTGKNMGAALSVGVTWGFRSREELQNAGADVTVDDAEALYLALGIKR
jgi:phosphoglycolate phosphatase